MIVERILDNKGRYVPIIQPDASVMEAANILESDNVGALIVSRDGSYIDGIVSERDIVRGLMKHGPNLLELPVSRIMTEEVITCSEDSPVAGVMALMDDNGIRHIPVTENDELVGMISIRDLISLRVEEVQAEADAMRRYISTIN